MPSTKPLLGMFMGNTSSFNGMLRSTGAMDKVIVVPGDKGNVSFKVTLPSAVLSSVPGRITVVECKGEDEAATGSGSASGGRTVASITIGACCNGVVMVEACGFIASCV